MYQKAVEVYVGGLAVITPVSVLLFIIYLMGLASIWLPVAVVASLLVWLCVGLTVLSQAPG